MRYSRPSLLLTVVLGLLAIVAVSGAGAPALGANCGGGTPCSCGDTVTATTVLTSADPVTNTVCPDNGLSVTTGVNLDLGGRTITGDGLSWDVGIIIAGDHVVIQNGRVTGFGTGVATAPMTATSGSTLASLQIFANGKGIRFAGTGTDPMLFPGSTLTDLQVRQNDGVGIDITASATTVTKSVIRFNGGDCLVFQDGPAMLDKNTVSLLRCEDNEGQGLVVRGVMNTIARNVLLRNGGNGADIDGSADTIDRNQSKNNGGEGFKIEGSDHWVTLNIAGSNVEDGFTVSAIHSHFERNISNYNGRPNVGWGILEVMFSGTNTYSKNNCTGNGLGDSSPIGLCQ